MKILSVYSALGDQKELFVSAMKDACDGLHELTLFNQAETFSTKVLGPYGLDELYRGRHSELLAMYDSIYSLACKNDVLIVDHENYLHPDFLAELSKVCYTVFYTTDDPETSYQKSMPYVPFFDHSFCCSVMHSETITMVDKLKFWGAKRADYRPLGVYPLRNIIAPDQIDEILSSKLEQVMYVGGPYSKSDFLIALKKHFRSRFILKGQWGGIRSHAFRLLKKQFYVPIRPISDKELTKLYTKSLVGVNMHLSYGPSNFRSFELPAFGCAQVSDNRVGYDTIYDVGKEILCYDNQNLDQCITKIERLLSNPKDAKNIAKAAYHRVTSEYTFKSCFLNSLEKIKLGSESKNGF